MTKQKGRIENLKNFTTENQPSPEAKSKGAKKRWDRKRLKDDLFKEFVKPMLNTEGKEVQTLEAGVKLLKETVFSSDLSKKEKSEMFVKFCDFLGIKETQLSFDDDVQVQIYLPKKNKEK